MLEFIVFVPNCIQVATLRVLKMAFSGGKKRKIFNSHKHFEVAQGSNYIIFTLTNKNFIAVVQGTWETLSQNERVSRTEREALS